MDSDLRVVLSFMDGSSLATTSPFRIADELRRLAGDVDSACPTAAGKLSIIAANQEQLETLIKLDSFLDRAASFTAPGRSVDAYIYAPSLSEVPDEELLTHLRGQGVTGVFRIRPSEKKSPGIRLRFRGGTLPPTIRAGFQDIQIRPWQRSPLLCRRCAEYGHLKKTCRATKPRCLRCSEEHETDGCKSTTPKCPHCTKRHPAWDKRCTSLAEYVLKKQVVEQPPEPRSPGPMTDASSQTEKTATKNSATTAKPHTASASTGPAPPTCKTVKTQTEDLPVFTELVTIIEEPAKEPENPHEAQVQEDTEDADRWRRRTRRTKGAAVPPPIPDRVGRPPPDSRRGSTVATDDHHLTGR